MQPLYKIQQDYLAIYDRLVELEGELTPELESQLEITQDQLRQKASAYMAVIKAKEAEVEMLKAEADRLTKRRKTIEATSDRLSQALLAAVQSFGDIDTDTFTLTTRASKAVEVVDEAYIPTDYFTKKEVVTLDKRRVGEDLKKGLEVNGCQLITRYSLRIK